MFKHNFNALFKKRGGGRGHELGHLVHIAHMCPPSLHYSSPIISLAHKKCPRLQNPLSTLSFWLWPTCRESVWVFRALEAFVCRTLPVRSFLGFVMPAVVLKRQPLYRRNPPGENANFRTEGNLVQPLASINIIQPVSRGATLPCRPLSIANWDCASV